MKEFLQLYRSLTVRQIVGVELAWAASLLIVFSFVTWKAEQALRVTASDNVSWRYGLQWDLSVVEVGAIGIILLVPILAWLLVRDRSSPPRTL